jgi:hypothetical protein
MLLALISCSPFMVSDNFQSNRRFYRLIKCVCPVYGLLLQVVIKQILQKCVWEGCIRIFGLLVNFKFGHSVVRTKEAKRCNDFVNQTCYRLFPMRVFPNSQFACFTTTTRKLLLIVFKKRFLKINVVVYRIVVTSQMLSTGSAFAF